MKLILDGHQKKLLANYRATMDAQANDEAEPDHKPVVKLFTPWTAATWLFSEMDSERPELVFGLCDLGLGSPELGWTSLTEIKALRGPFGLAVERDLHWTPKHPLSVYTAASMQRGLLVDNPEPLAVAEVG